MTNIDDLSSVTNVDRIPEYYEELDDQTLDFRKRKVPTPIPTTSFIKKSSPIKLDPIKDLNEKLNRQFRPDLVPPTPLPPPPVPLKKSVKRIQSPNPVIFDARAKPVKSPKKTNESSFSVTRKLFDRLHQLTAPNTESNSSQLEMPHQQSAINEYQVPPGMMLVPISQQQQSNPTVSQNKPPTVVYNNSFKNNKVAPPPSAYNTQTGNQVVPNNSFISPSSMMSTNPLLQSSYATQQQQQQQQQASKHIDQSKTLKLKPKNQSTANPAHSNNPNRSYALYNQENGRIEGVVKNRLNIANDDLEESQIIDEETEPKGKWASWFSEPLCLGLTRLSGGILFGSMILLSCASVAGLIASIVLYTKDSVTDAQWKILGMVVCAIMLITIIITLLIFICCYKHGYMFNEDDDTGPNEPSITRGSEKNDNQKAVLRKIYKFNRPNDTQSVPSGIVQDVSTSPSISQPPIHVNDKQTNTEVTIAALRPKDIDRGVWPSINAFGGISYRPLIQPQVMSRYIQVIPQDFEQTIQVPQVIYQVVAPAAAMSSAQIQPSRIIQIPAQQPSVLEVIEPSKKQTRTTVIRQPKTKEILVQPTTRIEYVDVDEKPTTHIEYVDVDEKPTHRIEYVDIDEKPTRRIEYIDNDKQSTRRIIQQPQYEIVDTDKQSTRRIIQQPQYEIVDTDKQPTRRIVQQPQYEIVEEVIERPTSSSTMEEIVEIVDAPKHTRKHRRKKGNKKNVGTVSVKHIKAIDD